MKKLTLSVALNLLFILFFVGKRVYYTYGFANPVSPKIDWLALAEEKNKEKIALFNDYPIDSNDIVFVGNSLTEGLQVQEYFCDVKNRGIGGNTIDHVQGRIEQITKGRPKKIFLEIGINDINKRTGIDTIETEFEKLIETIREQSPNTQIIIQSLLPTRGSYIDVLPVVKEFNIFLNKFSSRYNLHYIDLYTPMLNNGSLDSSLTRDGLHLNEKGYKRWRDQIKLYVH